MLLICQCRACGNIVSDSSQWLSAIPERDQIALGGVSPGSTVVSGTCISCRCGAVLGHYCKPGSLDAFAGDAYVLNADSLRFYQTEDGAGAALPARVEALEKLVMYMYRHLQNAGIMQNAPSTSAAAFP